VERAHPSRRAQTMARASRRMARDCREMTPLRLRLR
jgi:hypothetical protein